MRRLLQQRGDTLVEVTIALAILATVLTSSFAVAGRAYRVGMSAKERSQAVNLMQAQAEALRAYRDQHNQSWATFTGGVGGYGSSGFAMSDATGSWRPASCGSGACTSGIFTVKTIARQLDIDKYQFDITATWDAQGGGTNTSTISTYLVNLESVPVCDPASGLC